MKHTVIETRDEYQCDVCGNDVSGTYDLGKLSSAGNTYIQGINVDYGYKIIMSKYGQPAEHVCKKCLQEFLEKLLDKVKCGQ